MLIKLYRGAISFIIWLYKTYKGSPDTGANSTDKGWEVIVGEGAVTSNRCMPDR